MGAVMGMRWFAGVTVRGAALVVALAWPLAASAAEPTYAFGLYFNVGGAQDAQVKTLLSEAMQLLADDEGFHFQFKYFREYEEYMKALEDRTLDFAYSNLDPEKIIPGYSRAMTNTVYGTSSYKNCLYVKKDSGFKTLEDIKGKKAMTYPTPMAYNELRRILRGEPPETYFLLGASASGMSSFFALSLKQVDVVHSTETAYKHMQKTNPGPVKNVKVLVCSDIVRHYPAMLVKDAVSPAFRTHVLEVLKGAHKHPKLKRFHPLMQMAGFRFVELKNDNYEQLIANTQDAMKLGWDKDYASWIRVSGAKINN